MVLEIVISVALLFAGIVVLGILHVCLGGRIVGVTRESIMSSTIMRRSMSEDDIKKLPWYDYKLDQETDADEVKRVVCAVCLEGFNGGDKCRLLPKCKHSFHVNCIDSWLIKTAACPVCRTCVDFGESRFPGDCLELT